MKNLNLPQILRKYADDHRWSMDHWLNGLPSVTVLCPTYGRPYLLNEAIESFLRQDYEGEKRMLIFNDQPDLKIISDIPKVRVINKEERYPTLAEKRKDLITMADTDLSMLYGDDDILMPWALSTAISGMVSHFLFVILGYVRYNQKRDVIRYLPNAPLPGPILYNTAIAKKANIKQSHEPPGFELQMVSGLKKHIPIKMGPLINNQSRKIPADKVFYMVRTNLPYHKQASLAGYDKCGEYVKSLKIGGEHKIEPVWERDYDKMVKQAVAIK